MPGGRALGRRMVAATGRLLDGRRGEAAGQRLADRLAAGYHWPRKDYRANVKALERWRGRYDGQRCVIMGNGPSLNQMDLGLLRGEMTFGLNRIYLLFPRMGFATSFVACVNPHVLSQWEDDFRQLAAPTFVRWDARQRLREPSRIHYLHSQYRSGPRFSRDIAREGVWEGATVTYVAMQLAYYMGFTEVLLVGVDHSFATKGTPHQLVQSQGADPNHFDPDYFGKGAAWQLPDLETSELAYRMAKDAFEADGRRILDATVGGRLQVFPKIKLEQALGGRRP